MNHFFGSFNPKLHYRLASSITGVCRSGGGGSNQSLEPLNNHYLSSLVLMVFSFVSTRWRCWAWTSYPHWWPGYRTDSGATLGQVRLCLFPQHLTEAEFILSYKNSEKNALFTHIFIPLIMTLVSAPQPYWSVRRRKRPSARPRPKSAFEDHGPGSQPTGEQLTHGGNKAAHTRGLTVCCCSICGIECWEVSSTRTVGPEKDCAFVSSPPWTRESNLRSWCDDKQHFSVLCVWWWIFYSSSLDIVCLFDPLPFLLLPGMELKAWPSVKFFLTYVSYWGTQSVRSASFFNS